MNTTRWYWLMYNHQLAEQVEKAVLTRALKLRAACNRIHAALQTHPTATRSALHGFTIKPLSGSTYAAYTGFQLVGSFTLVCCWDEDSFHLRAWEWGKPPDNPLTYGDGRDGGYVCSLDQAPNGDWRLVDPPDLSKQWIWVLEQGDIAVREACEQETP